MAIPSEVTRQSLEIIIGPVYQISHFIEDGSHMSPAEVENLVELVIIIVLNCFEFNVPAMNMFKCVIYLFLISAI